MFFSFFYPTCDFLCEVLYDCMYGFHHICFTCAVYHFRFLATHQLFTPAVVCHWHCTSLASTASASWGHTYKNACSIWRKREYWIYSCVKVRMGFSIMLLFVEHQASVLVLRTNTVLDYSRLLTGFMNKACRCHLEFLNMFIFFWI